MLVRCHHARLTSGAPCFGLLYGNGWKRERDGKERKPYTKPRVTEPTAKQIRGKLLRLADRGDPKAKKLLQTMFPEDPHKDPNNKKKSA